QAAALELVEAARAGDCRVALQACGELYAALTRRLGRAQWEAAQAARNVLTAFQTYPATRTAVQRALAEAGAGRLSYWDALLLASADEAGCDICFSEDMADGLRLGSVEVVQPFGAGGLTRRTRGMIKV